MTVEHDVRVGPREVPDELNGERHSGRYRPIANPATGEQIQFTTTAADGDGSVVRFDWRSAPGGAITEHFHPHQEERFLIVSGEAHFVVEGQRRIVGAGESIVISAGARHAEVNPGSIEVVGVVELRPALRSKEMYEAFAGLAREGKTSARGAPKNPLQLGATIWRFRNESRATSPPVWLQNLLLPPLAVLAKLFRVLPYRARWDSRCSAPAERS